jgi:hypothetical protein
VINKLLSHLKIFTGDMEIILKESQYIKLLIEENLDNAQSEFEKSDSIVRKILKDVKLGYKLNFTMALTWGPIMGGLLRPVGDYLNNLDPSISSSDLSLILFGVMVTFFSSNKELLNKTLKLIKEKKLVTYFDRAVMKTWDLKDAFVSFLESLGVTVSNVSNMIAYSFLIPLIPQLFHLRDLNFSEDDLLAITKGITASTVAVVNKTLVLEVLRKIIKRFKTSKSSE